MAELETDVQHLQGELERQEVQLREADRDKMKTIGELSEQNHRLLEQLSRVSTGSVLSAQAPQQQGDSPPGPGAQGPRGPGAFSSWPLGAGFTPIPSVSPALSE